MALASWALFRVPLKTFNGSMERAVGGTVQMHHRCAPHLMLAASSCGRHSRHCSLQWIKSAQLLLMLLPLHHSCAPIAPTDAQHRCSGKQAQKCSLLCPIWCIPVVGAERDPSEGSMQLAIGAYFLPLF